MVDHVNEGSNDGSDNLNVLYNSIHIPKIYDFVDALMVLMLL